VADQQLAEANARQTRLGAELQQSQSAAPENQLDLSESDSVSTISTNRSPSPPRSRSRGRGDRFLSAGQPSRHRSRTPDMPRKRKHRSISSSFSRSPRSPRPEAGSHRKSRRHRTVSPIDRGRPNSMRRGSHRSRSNSPSMDKSQITKQRRSLDVDDSFDLKSGGRGASHGEIRPSPRANFTSGEGKQPGDRRERSMSPYSKRWALTKAMNM
jgi:hypothetical protein